MPASSTILGRHPGRLRGAVLAGAVLALVAAGCTGGEEGRFATEEVSVGDVVERVSAPGSVRPAAQAEVRAPSDARVAELAVSSGERVEEGQLVARLSSEQVNDSLAQAEAAVASTASVGAVPALDTGSAVGSLGNLQAQVDAASQGVLSVLRGLAPSLPERERAALEAHLERAEKDIEAARLQAERAARDAAAQAEAQTAALRRSLEAMGAAQRAQAQAALDAAQDAKQRLTLRAPIGGTVQLGRAGEGGGAAAPSIPGLPPGAGQALEGLAGDAGGGGGAAGPPLAAGAEVSAGQVVATILDLDALTVAAEVDETDVALVAADQTAEVELDAFPGVLFGATVAEIATTPTGGGQVGGAAGVSYQVDLDLGAPLAGADGLVEGVEPAPKVGMTATAEINVREAVGTPTVASSALVGRGTGQAVLVVEGGVVRLRPVRLAASGEDRIAVAEGVRAGDRVVTRGAERLRDGQEYPGD